ncbi:hypothetical protein RIF29_21218 [Crotalaria pallida]|uniref:Uncharacterized protein n=1 Tax=Crotalaria pallida TaxID=3830 RepID=A0AAN9FB57_CROPI
MRATVYCSLTRNKMMRIGWRGWTKGKQCESEKGILNWLAAALQRHPDSHHRREGRLANRDLAFVSASLALSRSLSLSTYCYR